MKIFEKPFVFDWDKGNIGKNKKHGVGDKEAEEAFFDRKRKIYKDPLHSGKEERNILIGTTKRNRLLYIVFTMRGKEIRIISARDINQKEVAMYEKKA
ncbi:MAG: BrnT family toxin [Patescibacteria group bacterium]